MAALSADLNADTSGTFTGSLGAFATAETTRNAAKPLGQSPVARALAVDELVEATVRLVLEPYCRRVVLGTCSAINVHPPLDHGEPQALHRDDSMWAASAWTRRVHYSVSVMWAVSDFTRTNGATRLALGSHLPPRTEAAETQVAEMSAGDVLLWLGGVLHGAGDHHPRHVDGSTREGLLFIYNLGWLRSEHNFHNALPPEVVQNFDPKLKLLLGYFGQNAADHPWFTGPVYAQPYLGGPQGTLSGDGVQFKIDQAKLPAQTKVATTVSGSG